MTHTSDSYVCYSYTYMTHSQLDTCMTHKRSHDYVTALFTFHHVQKYNTRKHTHIYDLVELSLTQ